MVDIKGVGLLLDPGGCCAEGQEFVLSYYRIIIIISIYKRIR